MSNIISWPGWELGELLVKGDFCCVYEIHRQMFGTAEQAALTVISLPQSQAEVEELRLTGYDDAALSAHYQQQAESIYKEYSSVQKLGNCPNVVRCDDVRCTPHEDGIGWDVCIKSELLAPLLKKLDTVTSEAQVVRLGIDLCNALATCVKKVIIHGNIKPSCIFISESGEYKLSDFGIAKVLEPAFDSTQIGNVTFMAPEVFNGQRCGHSSDVYSLGMVLYWLLNERRAPFLPPSPALPNAHAKSDASRRRLKGEALPPTAHGSQELQQIVLKACAFSPKQRYKSALDMLEDLKKLNPSSEEVLPPPIPGKEPVSTVPESPPQNTSAPETMQPSTDPPPEFPEKPKSSSLKKWLPIILGGVMILLLAFILYRCSKEPSRIAPPTTAATSPTSAAVPTAAPTQPSATQTTQSPMTQATEPTTHATEPATTPASEPTTQATEPATTPASEPTTQATEPATSPATEATTPQATEPDTTDSAGSYGIRLNGKKPNYGTEVAAELTIGIGDKVDLKVVDENGKRVDAEWTASKEGIVTIDGTTITGATKGKVVLTIEINSQEFTVTIHVR